MDSTTDEFALAKKSLAKDIVGEIVLSENSEKVIRKWRTIFKISQKKLAAELGITSSVISDYESGRRKSPGIKMIKRYVEALLEVDAAKGGNVIRSFAKVSAEQPLSNAIMDIKEFSSGVPLHDFLKRIDADLVTKGVASDREIYGYTIVDSLKAITELSFSELVKLYGMTTQRALIFTKVGSGKTPMVAIKLTNLHPALVIFHGPETVDDVAKRIAEVENIPLAVSRVESPEKIVEKLKGL